MKSVQLLLSVLLFVAFVVAPATAATDTTTSRHLGMMNMNKNKNKDKDKDKKCAVNGQICDVNKDCCNKLICDFGRCNKKGDALCKDRNEKCVRNGDCCQGLFCVGGECGSCLGKGGRCGSAYECCGFDQGADCINRKCTGSCKSDIGKRCTFDTDCCGALWCRKDKCYQG